jgi:hypothetical protein
VNIEQLSEDKDWISYTDEYGRVQIMTRDGRYTLDTGSGYWYDWETKGWLWYDAKSGTYQPLSNDTSYTGDILAPLGDETIRLVVITSSILTPHHVAVIDASGVTLARDRGPGHRLRLPELAVSKFHAQIYYDAESIEEGEKDEEIKDTLKCPYWIVDCGSKHGTFVNEKRLSESRMSSRPYRLTHGDFIRLGSTTFQVHAHDAKRGWGSCKACALREDNALRILWETETRTKTTTAPLELGDRRILSERARRQELERMKCKYRVDAKSIATERKATTHHHDYVDRAALRRALDPDDEPYTTSTDTIQTPTKKQPRLSARTASAMATCAPALDANNVGYRMLQQMGWSIDTHNASTVSGAKFNTHTMPVGAMMVARPERLGLGADGGEAQRIAEAYEEARRTAESPRSTAWRLARERYSQCANTSIKHYNVP